MLNGTLHMILVTGELFDYYILKERKDVHHKVQIANQYFLSETKTLHVCSFRKIINSAFL